MAITLDGKARISSNNTTDGSNADFGGAGLYLAGESTLTLSGKASVDGNISVKHGGGVFLAVGNGSARSHVVLKDSAKVSGNAASDTGGGVYSDNVENTVTGGTRVTGNTPDQCAGTSCA